MSASDADRAERLAAALDAENGGDEDLADLLALAHQLECDVPDLLALETTLPEPSTGFQRRLRDQLVIAPPPPARWRRLGRRGPLALAGAIAAALLALAGLQASLGGWAPGAVRHAADTARTAQPTAMAPSAFARRNSAPAPYQPGGAAIHATGSPVGIMASSAPGLPTVSALPTVPEGTPGSDSSVMASSAEPATPGTPEPGGATGKATRAAMPHGAARSGGCPTSTPSPVASPRSGRSMPTPTATPTPGPPRAGPTKTRPRCPPP